MGETIKVFVYGTLKVGGKYSEVIKRLRKSSRRASIIGTMFNINNAFPAITLDGDTAIHGELHVYDKTALKRLDAIEGYISKDDQANLYNRETTLVSVEGKKVEAFVYTFAKKVEEYPLVKEGRWPI